MPPRPDPKLAAAAAYLAAQEVELRARGPACPFCRFAGSELKYVRQRPGATHRFRQCRGCGRRFRTVETAR